MTDETSIEKAIRVISFTGKLEDWRMWSRKFLARARVKKYKEVLMGTQKVPSHDEDLDLTTEAGKVKQKARTNNDNAYNDLLLSCADEVSFGAVDEAVTDELPDGDACLAWKNLNAKYEPKMAASLVILKKEFADSALEDSTKDPDEWIADLERLRQRMKTLKAPIADEDFIIHVLNNLPIETSQ